MPSCWIEAGEKQFMGTKTVDQTPEMLKMIRERMLAARTPQKSYEDKKQRPITL